MPEITTRIPDLRGPCEVLLTLADPVAAPGDPVTLLLLDRAGNSLVELDWTPGAALAARSVPLGAPMPEVVTAASVAGQRLCLSGSDDEVLLIDRDTGAVDSLALAGPACLAPDGRALVAATERGLLIYRMWPRAGGGSNLPGPPEPLLVADLHAAGAMVVLPTSPPGGVELAIGGFAHVALARLAELGAPLPRGGVEIARPGNLPAEDVQLVLPPPALVMAERRLLYASDSTRYALCAVDIDALASFACPLGSGGYGRLHRIVSALDSGSCRIGLRGDTTLSWRPGSDPVAAPLPHGLVAFHETTDLVLDTATGLVREQPGA